MFFPVLTEEISMTCQATVCAMVGQSLVKRCAISGLPAPNISVRKISGPASSLPLASLSGLAFSAVTLEDRGIYTITGQNILEVKTLEASVQLGVDICGKKQRVYTEIANISSSGTHSDWHVHS